MLPKFLTLLGKITTVSLIIATTFSMQATLDVNANSPIKTEALLTINYNKSISISELNLNLKKDIKDQNLVQVSSISASLNLNNNTQTFTQTNDSQPTIKFLRGFHRQVNAVIPTMISLKEEGKINAENKALLNKYSIEELKRSKKTSSDVAY